MTEHYHNHIFAKWEREGGRELQFSFDDINSDSMVWDIGLYKGDWTSEIYEKYHPYIFAFEPVKSFYDFAVERFRGNEKISIFNFGLGDRKRFDRVKLSGDGTSLFKENKTESVEIRDISEEFVHRGLRQVDLLALNCEGAEYEILRRLFNIGIINKFNQLFIQFHNLKEDDKRLRDEICVMLTKTHNRLYCYAFVWELWKRKERN
ncbi:MAG: FkbM family methyltransferase [Nitrosopumilus sp.]